MKKFYAFAAAAALAVSANAQSLYMTGASAVGPEQGGLPANWAPSNPAEFEIVEGNFQLTVKGLQMFKISTAKSEVEGDWGDAETGFNSGVLTCNYGEEPGATVALEPGDGTSPNILCPWEGDWTVVVAGDLSTITMTTTTPKPEGGIQIYLRGDMNTWDNIEGWMFEQVNETVFKFVFSDDQEIKIGDTFKIADSSWTKYNYGAASSDAILLDTDTEVVQGSNDNMTLEEACNGVVWFTLDLEGSAYAVFSNDKAFVPEWAGENAVSTIEVSNGEAQYFNLQGVRVANPENGLYIVVKDGKSYKTILK